MSLYAVAKRSIGVRRPFSSCASQCSYWCDLEVEIIVSTELRTLVLEAIKARAALDLSTAGAEVINSATF